MGGGERVSEEVWEDMEVRKYASWKAWGNARIVAGWWTDAAMKAAVALRSHLGW